MLKLKSPKRFSVLQPVEVALRSHLFFEEMLGTITGNGPHPFQGVMLHIAALALAWKSIRMFDVFFELLPCIG